MLDLHTILVRAAQQALNDQKENGSMPAGNNGPYLDPETPVRNTSHWLITFQKAHDLTGEEKYKQAAEKCLSYILSEKARPMNATFWHRKNPNKDFSNGLMGQAWTLEALMTVFKKFGDDKVRKLAEEVFLLHPYNPALAGWKIVNVDGSIKDFDRTFNHQLWFAAIGNELAAFGNREIQNQTSDFISKIRNNLEIYPKGVIRHHPIAFQKAGAKQKLLSNYRELRKSKTLKEYTYSKSVGYHGFNLLALRIIADTTPDLKFFSEVKFKKTIQVLDTTSFQKELEASKYGYPYNPPGLEIANALEKFGDKKKVDTWLNIQMKKTFNFQKDIMGSENSFDKPTAGARIYEACRLENYPIFIDE